MRILGTLHAASTSGRTRTYRLLAWGERGRTDVGAVTVDPGVLTLPTEPVPANVQHDPLHPVALTQITPDDAGLLADVTFLDTTAGSDALAEVDAGVRPGISIEVDNPIVRAGRLLGGLVDAVGLVVAPAFPSSRLLAADCGEPTTQITAPAPGEVNAAPAAEEETSAMDDDESTTEAAVETEATDTATLVYGTDQSRLTAALPASVRPGGKSSKEPRFLAAFAASDEQGRAGLRTRLNAALDQATAADLAPSMVTQWIGEVWNGRTYVRQFVPLLNHGDLTGLKALGWRFKDGKTPKVDTYAGYPAQPNSNAVE
ncbi:MAG: hypothetical protein KJ792_02740, partial [Actinobacteria bacterium]|nr:hypothetical protein [Actinomycetota bacterium]